MKTLYLVDVSAIFFRAYYAIPDMITSQGLQTNALYGFLATTIKILRENKSEYIVYCQDLKGPTFRVDLYPEYKANRSEMPEDLTPQMPYIDKIIDALGIPKISKKGYEADDVIGCLTHYGVENNFDVVIESSDKDFAQLVSQKVKMHDPMKNKVIDYQ